MWSKAYLSLGSNIGDRVGYLKEAVALLEENPEITVTGKSAFYTTAPIGYLDQEDFVNITIEIVTTLTPETLLLACQSIEQTLKRVRRIHWGPRTIDVDLLWYDQFQSNSDLLTVPHPRMCERAFVMIPLCELNPCLVVFGKTVLDWCGQLTDQEVRKMTDETW